MVLFYGAKDKIEDRYWCGLGVIVGKSLQFKRQN